MPATQTSKIRRFNWRAPIALAALVASVGLAVLGWRLARPSRVRDEANAQVQRLIEDGHPDRALRHLDEYLGQHPDDPPLLLLQARLMAEQADSGPRLEQAALKHRRLLFLDGIAEADRDEVKRRLADIYITLTNAYRTQSLRIRNPEGGVMESRYAAADTLLREILGRHPDDAEAHLLRGRALERMFDAGDPVTLDQAAEEYRRAFDLDRKAAPSVGPGDEARDRMVQAAIRLASVHRDLRDAPEDAATVLEELDAALPDDPGPPLARFRFFRESDGRRADAAIDKALEAAPGDYEVRMAAAENELSHGNPAAARGHLDAASAAVEGEPVRLRLLRGMADFAEQRPEAAVAQWLGGLELVGGSDAELNWWLAFVFIRLDRLDDARPLIDHRYRATSGLDEGQDAPELSLLKALRDEQLGDPYRARATLEAIVDELDDRRRVEALLAIARCNEALGETSRAGEIYRRLSESDGRSVVPVLQQARLLQQGGQDADAADLLEEAIGDRQGGLPDLRINLVRVRLSEQATRPSGERSWEAYDRALEAAEAVVPNSAELLTLRAEHAMLDDRPERVDDLLEEALTRSPENPRIWSTLAELTLRDGRPGDALRVLDRGTRADAAGDNATLRMTRAQILVELGRGREAQRGLVDGIDELPESDRAALWEALGRLRMDQADPSGARDAFLAWAVLSPESPAPLLNLLELALKSGDFGAADAILAILPNLSEVSGGANLPYRLALKAGDFRKARAALGAPPNAVEAADEAGLPYRLAVAMTRFHQAGRSPEAPEAATLERADEAVDSILEDAPSLPDALLLRGRIKLRRGQLDDAAEAYRAALDGGAAGALPELIDLLARLGRFEEIEALAEARAGLGARRLSTQALIGAGQADRAARMLDRAVDDPSDPTAVDAWRTRMLELAGRTDELEDLLRIKAEQARVTDPAPWIALIDFQIRNGRSDGAIDATIRQALESTPGVDSGLLEGRLRWAAGDAGAADDAVERALKARPDDPILLAGAANYYDETDRPDLAESPLETLAERDDLGDAAGLQLAMLLSKRSGGDPSTWQRALALTEGSDDSQHRLARAIVLSRASDVSRRAEAIPLLEGVLADLPAQHADATKARELLARAFLERGQSDRAAEVTAITAAQPGAGAEAALLHVRALLQDDRLAEAEQGLDRLDLLQPGDPSSAALRADLAYRMGGPEALEDAVSSRIGSPGVDVLASSACMRLLNAGDPEAIAAAVRIAENLADRSPDHAWVAGLVLAIQGRSEEALERCEEALDTIKISETPVRLGLTDAVLRAVDAAPFEERSAALARARPIIETLRERRPDDPDLMIQAAGLHHLAGEFEAEAELYREVLRRRPADGIALYNLALITSEGLGDPEGGLKLIDRYRERTGPIAAALGARGVILMRLGRTEEAIADLERALALGPTADRHYHLARAYLQAGDDETFRLHFDRAIRDGLGLDTIDIVQREEFLRLSTR